MKNIIRTALNGFSMAIADSVPGVSGGTVAFMLGFYEQIITSIDNILSRKTELQKKGVTYISNLGLGWIIGFSISVLLLSWLFEKNVYFMSSVFLGLTVCAIPCIAIAEKGTLKLQVTHIVFLIIGFVLVATISLIGAGTHPMSLVNLREFGLTQMLYLFAVGIVALAAMILPGMSGTTILLITGVYIPTIRGVKGLMSLDLSFLPGLVAIGLGVATGVVLVVPLIRKELRKNRSKMIYLILGMTIGSTVSIVMGPGTVDGNLEPLNFGNFNLYGFIIGIIIVELLETGKLSHRA